ncbi:MAG: hypothetical protein IJ141_09775 [Lachnospiraceae bacterium]|nr:hypothetical protein [Lachnospiraceae bacterium]
MDENYLDDLLNAVSSDNKKNSKVDESVEKDSGVNIDMGDLSDLSLDEFDDLDSLDLGDLDFDDIDFDDIDITSLDSKPKKKVKEEQEDFSLDALFDEPEEQSDSIDDAEDLEAFLDEPEKEFMSYVESGPEPVAEPELEPEPIPEPIPEPAAEPELEPEPIPEPIPEASNQEEASQDSSSLSVDDMDLDDLFSALGIEDESKVEEDYVKSEDSSLDAMSGDLSDLGEVFGDFSTSDALGEPDEFGSLDDIADISEVKSEAGKKAKKEKKAKGKAKADKETKEKKTLSQILFGEPDAEELEEEEKLKAKKAAKKEERAKKKEENKEKKAEKLELKKTTDDKKKAEKLEKKKVKAEAAEEEAKLEAEENGKPVSKVLTGIIFGAFAALAAVVILGTNAFNYKRVIKKAADYFERQRYRLAYDEVAGVDVKEKDQELKDRIYTVMYVERLYESYENNMKLNRPDKALDSLIRGLEKYDEHYDEAVELEIVDDINLCRSNILSALSVTFDISEDTAYEIMEYDGQEYIDALARYSESIQTGE